VCFSFRIGRYHNRLFKLRSGAFPRGAYRIHELDTKYPFFGSRRIKEHLEAAGLDVFVQEPVRKDNPLLSMKNTATLPHIGSATYETRFKMAMLVATNLVAELRGKPRQP
jgi:hypothetical protein